MLIDRTSKNAIKLMGNRRKTAGAELTCNRSQELSTKIPNKIDRKRAIVILF